MVSVWMGSKDFFFNPLPLFAADLVSVSGYIMWLTSMKKSGIVPFDIYVIFLLGLPFKSSPVLPIPRCVLCVCVCVCAQVRYSPCRRCCRPPFVRGYTIWWSARAVRALVECRLSHSQHRWRNSVPAWIKSLPSSRYTWNKFFPVSICWTLSS